MKGIVYILRSTKTNRFYIGSTNNLARRVEEHRSGRSKYTRNSLPIELVFFQVFDDLKIARKIEYKLKRLKRRDIIKRIIQDGKIKLGPWRNG